MYKVSNAWLPKFYWYDLWFCVPGVPKPLFWYPTHHMWNFWFYFILLVCKKIYRNLKIISTRGCNKIFLIKANDKKKYFCNRCPKGTVRGCKLNILKKIHRDIRNHNWKKSRNLRCGLSDGSYRVNVKDRNCRTKILKTELLK